MRGFPTSHLRASSGVVECNRGHREVSAPSVAAPPVLPPARKVVQFEAPIAHHAPLVQYPGRSRALGRWSAPLISRAVPARRRKHQRGIFCVVTNRANSSVPADQAWSKYQTSHWARRPARPAARWRAWRRRSDESRKQRTTTLSRSGLSRSGLSRSLSRSGLSRSGLSRRKWIKPKWVKPRPCCLPLRLGPHRGEG